MCAQRAVRYVAHRKLDVLTLLRQAEQGVAAVPKSDLAQLVQVVQAPLQGGGPQGPGLLIHCFCQLHAVSIYLRAKRRILLQSLPAQAYDMISLLRVPVMLRNMLDEQNPQDQTCAQVSASPDIRCPSLAYGLEGFPAQVKPCISCVCKWRKCSVQHRNVCNPTHSATSVMQSLDTLSRRHSAAFQS